MIDLLASVVGLVVALVFTLIFAITAGRTRRAANRLTSLARAAWALLGLVLAHVITSWVLVPPLLWGVLVVIATVGAALLALRWRRLPWLPERRARRVVAWVQLGVAVVITAALLLG